MSDADLPGPRRPGLSRHPLAFRLVLSFSVLGIMASVTLATAAWACHGACVSRASGGRARPANQAHSAQSGQARSAAHGDRGRASSGISRYQRNLG